MNKTIKSVEYPIISECDINGMSAYSIQTGPHRARIQRIAPESASSSPLQDTEIECIALCNRIVYLESVIDGITTTPKAVNDENY